MERVVLIVQARMGSVRLPGKSMMSLAGEPLISRILERVKRCKSISQIVLAIPSTKENEILRDLGESNEVMVCEGPEHDLVERYYLAAQVSRANVVVRLPGDNPVPEPSEIDRIVRYHLSLQRRGFTSNLSEINNSGYPDGIGAEVFDTELLEVSRANYTSLEAREHIHLNFFNYDTGRAVDPNRIPVRTLVCPSGFRRPDIRLDVNTIEDYVFMNDLYTSLYPQNPTFSISDVIKWFDTNKKSKDRK